jgi:hypothetical protein
MNKIDLRSAGGIPITVRFHEWGADWIFGPTLKYKDCFRASWADIILAHHLIKNHISYKWTSQFTGNRCATEFDRPALGDGMNRQIEWWCGGSYITDKEVNELMSAAIQYLNQRMPHGAASGKRRRQPAR